MLGRRSKCGSSPDPTRLGLSAQRKAVQAFAGAEAFQIVAEFVEVETGKGADARYAYRQALSAATVMRARPSSGLRRALEVE